MLERHDPRESRRLEHAYFQRSKPSTLLIDELEAIWAAIAERDDWSVFAAKIEEIREIGAAYSAIAATGTAAGSRALAQAR